MEHFNDILFHKSEPANKQRTNQSMICIIYKTLLRPVLTYDCEARTLSQVEMSYLGLF